MQNSFHCKIWKTLAVPSLNENGPINLVAINFIITLKPVFSGPKDRNLALCWEWDNNCLTRSDPKWPEVAAKFHRENYGLRQLSNQLNLPSLKPELLCTRHWYIWTEFLRLQPLKKCPRLQGAITVTTWTADIVHKLLQILIVLY